MIKFNIQPHENILATHRNTLEFTKDKHLTRRGNCILGVGANFGKIRLQGKFRVTIKCRDIADSLIAEANPDFNSEYEIVIRKTRFNSSRTLGINSNKSAMDINRELVKCLRKNPGIVIIESLENTE